MQHKLQRLLVDAEYRSGLGDAEGCRYQVEGMTDYNWIRRHFRRPL